MREHKFRGALCHNNEWVVGSLIIADTGQSYIYPSNVLCEDGHHLRIDTDKPYWVKKETIGQYTGLKDKNGVEIYEGDIVIRINHSSTNIEDNKKTIGFVEYATNRAFFIIQHNSNRYSIIDATMWNESGSYDERIEVIGNIHQNKELL